MLISLIIPVVTENTITIYRQRKRMWIINIITREYKWSEYVLLNIMMKTKISSSSSSSSWSSSFPAPFGTSSRCACLAGGSTSSTASNSCDPGAVVRRAGRRPLAASAASLAARRTRRSAAAVAICRACASDRASGSATAQRSRGATRRGGAGRERNTPWLALEVASGINGCLDVSGLGKGLVDRLTMMNETIE